MKIFVFGSSLVSCYWNGAATYYRGIYQGLHARGHQITFAEPDIYGRQEHRDEEGNYSYADVRVYRGRDELDALLEEAADAELLVKHSGIGADDDYVAAGVVRAAGLGRARAAYWDVDAPATLAEMAAQDRHPLRSLLSAFDLVFTYGGGAAVVEGFRRYGARCCHPIYNGFDPTTHHPVAPAREFACAASFVGHRLPDREARVEEFFLQPAGRMPDLGFLLAGAGWQERALPTNVQYAGHAPSRWHNAINSSARIVLNINRASMAECGYSPPTRIFEAAGAGACIVSDAWAGMEAFFAPGEEILPAEDGKQVEGYIRSLSAEEAAAIGARARARALAEHTYDRRAQAVDAILRAATEGESRGAP